ncbi:MAG: epoxyqueuosine reductase [Lachnospiraceae bacterium]|nr:epoxyqueuosine reductase [Lachnospiraceae bacterium]
MELKYEIENLIQQIIEDSGYGGYYRDVLVGFVSAHDSGYENLTDIIGHKQVHPTEILPNAQTVIVYFLPFKEELGKKIQGEKVILQEWSDAYTITNKLLKHIAEKLITWLNTQGYSSRTIPPANDYQEETLTAQWSHKSSAVLAGLGSFGLNRLLVTKYGTTGRLGSVITDAYIEPSEKSNHQYCLYYQNGTCKACLNRCPSGAITERGIDRFRCNAYLVGKNVHLSQQGCPMCSSGPCAYRGF